MSLSVAVSAARPQMWGGQYGVLRFECGAILMHRHVSLDRNLVRRELLTCEKNGSHSYMSSINRVLPVSCWYGWYTEWYTAISHSSLQDVSPEIAADVVRAQTDESA